MFLLVFFIQVLYEKGGRKFGFLSLSPLGCLPSLRGLNSQTNEGVCFEKASDLALAHNSVLKAILASLQHILGGFKYCNSNFYDWLHDRMNNPSKYGMYCIFPILAVIHYNMIILCVNFGREQFVYI